MNELVSVLMAVYNTRESWLRIAIESILMQTYTNFEFLIVLDCPTDNSTQIVREYEKADSRIKVIENAENIGLTKSLNIALRKARGKYIARMDADDCSLPNRIEREVRYLEENPEVGVVGGFVYTGVKGPRIRTHWNIDPEVTRIHMLFHNAGVPHPSAMFRRVLPDGTTPVYNEQFKKSQDYALWADLIDKTKIVVLDEILLVYRIHGDQISANHSGQKQYAGTICMEQFKKHFGLHDIGDLEILKNIYFGDLENEAPTIADVKRVFAKLTARNAEINFVPQREFAAMLNEILLEYCYLNRHNKKILSGTGFKSICTVFSPVNLLLFVRLYIVPRLAYDRRCQIFKKYNEAFLRGTARMESY